MQYFIQTQTIQTGRCLLLHASIKYTDSSHAVAVSTHEINH